MQKPPHTHPALPLHTSLPHLRNHTNALHTHTPHTPNVVLHVLIVQINWIKHYGRFATSKITLHQAILRLLIDTSICYEFLIKHKKQAWALSPFILSRYFELKQQRHLLWGLEFTFPFKLTAVFDTICIMKWHWRKRQFTYFTFPIQRCAITNSTCSFWIIIAWPIGTHR